jgi:sugar phosphate isomerase/epimerase
MTRPITIFSAQWADLPFEKVCSIFSEIGYDGIEIACWGEHLDVRRAAADPEYVRSMKAVLEKYDLKAWSIGHALAGHVVGDLWDPRLNNFAPSQFAGNPKEIRAWAVEEMKYTARAAKNMNVSIVTGLMGSPIWKYWYSFPQTTKAMVDSAFDEIYEVWSPIFDEFDKCGVKFAYEVHPTEIAFDYYTVKRLFERFNNRPTLCLNFDPSHLFWQGIDPAVFLRDFSDKVIHVHIKDAAVRLDGRSGILGSLLEFGDTQRGWNFRSPGHGDVRFEDIIRELNRAGYEGPLSVEWEDSGMEREYGARDAFEFVKRINFAPSDVAFDNAIKSE